MLTGQVQWVNPLRVLSDNPNPGMGIRFIDLTLEARDRLIDTVRTIAYVHASTTNLIDGRSAIRSPLSSGRHLLRDHEASAPPPPTRLALLRASVASRSGHPIRLCFVGGSREV